MLRFNKIHVRTCEFDGEPTNVLEVFYSIGGDLGVAQIKDFTEDKRKVILRDLRSAIKGGYALKK